MMKKVYLTFIIPIAIGIFLFICFLDYNSENNMLIIYSIIIVGLSIVIWYSLKGKQQLILNFLKRACASYKETSSFIFFDLIYVHAPLKTKIKKLEIKENSLIITLPDNSSDIFDIQTIDIRYSKITKLLKLSLYKRRLYLELIVNGKEYSQLVNEVAIETLIIMVHLMKSNQIESIYNLSGNDIKEILNIYKMQKSF